MFKGGNIGVFDSGYGGLTILKEIIRLLPQYNYVYLGDNARAPYGTRSFEVVYQYAAESVRKLFEMNCNLVIFACNTASAKALRSIQQVDLLQLDAEKRVLGVIRPSVEALSRFSRNGHIGVLATRGTIASCSYPLEVEKLYGADRFKMTQLACPMWVPLVENNEFSGAGAEYFVRKSLEELFASDAEIDTIVLGCTHYPLLLPLIERFVPAHVKILSQGQIVSESLANYLLRHPEMEKNLAREGKHDYYTTDNAALFEHLGSVFMGHEIKCNRLQIC